MNSKTLGSTLLVAGTSIGAGMLALPLVSAATGFLPGIGLMLLMAGLSCYSGLLIAEACRAVPEAKNLHGVIGLLLGKPGQVVAIAAMLFLYFSLCAAYTSAGAHQLQFFLENLGVSVTYLQSAAVVVLCVATAIIIGTIVVDYANRMMFFVMLILLFLIMLHLLPEVQLSNLDLEPGAEGILLAALPVLYTSFGYHIAVPSVVRYVGGTPRHFTQAIIIGSMLPLFVYLLWQLAINGTVSSAVVNRLHLQENAVGLLIRKVGEVSHYFEFSHIISVFTACAIGTSFLGVALGLFDYLAEVSRRSNSMAGRIQTVTLTLLIPFCCAVFLPGSFVRTLGYAAVALVILSVFIPVFLVWKIRKSALEEHYQVSGGFFGLVVVTVLGALVIVCQIGTVFGFLPSID